MKSYPRILLIIAAACLMLASWAVLSASQAEEADQETGIFLSVAPDLVINTKTAEIKDSSGAIIVPAIERNGDLVGKYHASGYAMTVTEGVSDYVLATQEVSNRLVKAVSVIDTTTGKMLVKDKVYHDQPL